MKTPITLLLVLIGAAASAQAAGFTPGDIAVYRVGDGSSALSSAATAVFIDEYTPAGVLVQSIALPASATNPLTDSGSASSDGELTLSTNGQYLVFTGYGASAGTSGVTSSTTISRVVGTLNTSTGASDTTTQLSASSTYSGNNIRGAASQDGTDFWLAGTGSSANGGVRYATLGASSSSTIENGVTSVRAVGIYNGQLYLSSGSSSTFGVYSVGSGVSNSSGQTATQLPPGSEFTASVNYSGFYLTPDGTHLFVATGAATNSIQEFVLNAGNWSLDQSLNVNGSFQLSGMTLGNTTTLYYTLGSGSSANTLNRVSFDSVTSTFGSSSLVATAATNETFKGVAIVAAVPEPGAGVLVLGGLAFLMLGRRVFRRV